jgi:ribonuclease Z
MSSLSAELVVAGTGCGEGTGCPTLLLCTFREPASFAGALREDEAGEGAGAGQSSSSSSSPDPSPTSPPTPVETLFLNCGECSCRCASEARVKLASTTAVLLTRLTPSTVSGLPSLVFHLSDGGAAGLDVVGPGRGGSGSGTGTGADTGAGPCGTADVLAAIGSYVVRRYPEVAVEEVDAENEEEGEEDEGETAARPSPSAAASSSSSSSSSAAAGPRLVHDSRGAVPYVWGKAVGAGVRAWCLPVAGRAETSASATPGVKRRRDAPSGPRRAAMCCYVLCISGPAKVRGLAGSPAATERWIVVVDCASAGDVEGVRDAVERGLRALLPRGAAGSPTSTDVLLVHLADSSVATAPAYRLWTGQAGEEGHSRRHVFVRGGAGGGEGAAEATSHGAAAASSAAATVATHFPAAVIQAAHLHSVDEGVFPLALPGPLPPRGALRPLARVPLFPFSWATPSSPRADAAVDIGAERARARALIPPAVEREAAKEAGARTVAVDANRAAAAAMRRNLLGGGAAAPAPVLAPAPAPAPASSSTAVPYRRALVSALTPSVTFLGTGAAAPSKRRSCSAVLVDLGGAAGPCLAPTLLLDCGEGTLAKLEQLAAAATAEVSGTAAGAASSSSPPLDALLLSVRAIWVSHLHADHHTGLATVLFARGRARAQSATASFVPPLLVVGPPALEPLLRVYERLARAAAADEGWTYGAEGPVRFVRTGTALAATALVDATARGGPSPPHAQGSPLAPSPFPLTLAAWTDVPVQHSRDAYGCALTLVGGGASASPPLVLVYSGDTRPCEGLVRATVEAARAATGAPHGAAPHQANPFAARVVFVHEATFNDDRLADAERKRHSTVGEAMGVAARVGMGIGGGGSGSGGGLELVVLTHFSQRYPALGMAAAAATAAGDGAGAAAAAAAAPSPPAPPVPTLFACDLMRLPLLAGAVDAYGLADRVERVRAALAEEAREGRGEG